MRIGECTAKASRLSSQDSRDAFRGNVIVFLLLSERILLLLLLLMTCIIPLGEADGRGANALDHLGGFRVCANPTNPGVVFHSGLLPQAREFQL